MSRTDQRAGHRCRLSEPAPATSGEPLENTVLEHRVLAPETHLFQLYCPAVARAAEPGQFVVFRKDEFAERVPLTIADYDPRRGLLTVIIQSVGTSTRKLAAMERGQRVEDVIGPLGVPSEIEKFGTVVCVGGGVGIAPVYPIARALREAGNRVISIIGARSAEMLILEEPMREVSSELIITTDDGTRGRKGFVSDALQDLIDAGETIDRVIAIGPVVMMRAVAETTREAGIPTIASLNSIMVDGTGMCGGCRVRVGKEIRFTCVDGPEFDAHEVDFAMLMRRLSMYRGEEHVSADRREQEEERRAAQAARKPKGRVPMRRQAPESRARNFDEVALGYSEEEALAEAARCLQCKRPRCVAGCPVEIDIPEFIRLLAERDYEAAVLKIKEKNALPAVCGRVCPQENQCEALCILGKKGEPVAIGRLERFLADREREAGAVEIPHLPPPSGKRVAIVGSGPAGLTCAADLARMGHSVTIFEALHKPGGVLVYGIPEFRLPKAIVQAECDYIRQLGVRIEVDRVIGKIESLDDLLEKEGFDAVFAGTGAGLPYFLGIPGEESNGVFSSNEFLTRANLMKAWRFPEYDTPLHVGRRVGVVGGGNVAMDSARVARRMGAEEVRILYRRSEKELPAREEEIENALEEGIKLVTLVSPVRILADEKGWVRGVELIRMRLGEPDASGRRRPVPIAGSEYTEELDTLVVAIGQGPNPLLTAGIRDLERTRHGYIAADTETGKTSKRGVFAGGDIVTGAATVIEAMGAGKRAARAIDQYLKDGTW
jgi:glutamate synthase (NADPH/NADH) small chain